MTKCNRNVCEAEGLFAHVDILYGHDGKPARYCLRCADLINRANFPMAGYQLVPTSSEQVGRVVEARCAAYVPKPGVSKCDYENELTRLAYRLINAMPEST